ncbi:hypothetical protein KR009_009437, partial [Drosophila setifemur]
LNTNMSDVEERDLSASRLNHNVSFSSTMVTSGGDMSLPKLSVTLTDVEALKLHKKKATTSSKSINQSESLEIITTPEACRQEKSVPIINIEDTIEEYVGIGDSEAIEMPKVNAAEYFQNRFVELGRRCWTSTQGAQHYTKGCSWSPDGTCLLLPVHLDGMHVMELPTDLYSVSTLQLGRKLTKMQSAVHVPQAGTVYDCVWYPLMNSHQTDTCFWLATRQHEPIIAWDAFDGSIRCSYSGYDAVDEVMAAISLAFSHDGQKIFAGYKRCVKIFDTNRPGRLCEDYPVKIAISCIAQTTEHPNALTCGNWHGYIQHFDLRSNPKQGPLFTLGGHKGGITQLRYSAVSTGGWHLFSGARKCEKLLQWDMRNYKQPLVEFHRQVHTNQRIQFDLTADGGWLASGDTQGFLNVWDLSNDANTTALPVHSDCCNGVSLNPILPILATSSGQYHPVSLDTEENYITFNSSATCAETQLFGKLQQRVQLEVIYENAVLMWWCGLSA